MLKIIAYYCMTGKDRKIMASPGVRYGNWALVAGAAEGIGEGFCQVLASVGFHIILVDRNASAMHALAQDLEQRHHIGTLEVLSDLAAPDAAAQCMSAIAENDCRLLVYVAAWSRVSRFTSLEPDDLEGFLNVNTRTLLHLVHGFSKRLVSAGLTGGILLVSSLAGLIGPKYVAPYAATKSFSIRLAEALHDEMKGHGIDITTCCSGTVSTPTYRKSNPDLSRMKPPLMQARDVAAYALRNLGKKTICIPGSRNRFQYFVLMNLLPRRVARRLVSNAMEKMYGPL